MLMYLPGSVFCQKGPENKRIFFDVWTDQQKGEVRYSEKVGALVKDSHIETNILSKNPRKRWLLPIMLSFGHFFVAVRRRLQSIRILRISGRPDDDDSLSRHLMLVQHCEPLAPRCSTGQQFDV